MSPKPPTKRSYSHGWKESPRKPLTPEGKKRRTEWLAGWNARMHGLLLAEAERR
jgi:hypothetical protein